MPSEILPGGLVMHLGRLTKREESEAYAILAGGPKVIVRDRRYSPAQIAELVKLLPQPKLAAKAAQPEPDSTAPSDASPDTPPAGG